MANFYRDNTDIQFYMERGVDWDELVEVTEFGYRIEDGFRSKQEALEFYNHVLEMVGEFVAEEVAPRAAEIDRGHVELVDGEAKPSPAMEKIFKQIHELELHGMMLPRDLGGMNSPLLLYFLASELFARGDVSVMAHLSFHGGMAMAMLAYSLQEGTTELDTEHYRIKSTRFQEFIEEITRGKAWGSMDITEPDAGSDMASLRARGEQDEDGNWFVTGQKIFITSGHGKYHFVIARTEEAKADSDDPLAGLGGLSMFLVPAYRDNPDGTRERLATIERIEEKLGHHGSVTAAINFDRTPAHLIGKRGDGFRHMLTLMNNARLGVGFECIGLCESAYRMAKAYAEERPSMGKTIDKHEMIADYLDEMETDILGLRALAVEGAIAEEMARKLEMQGRDAVSVKRYQRRARRLTPLLKYLASEKAVEMSRRCVQIHGGNGYMKEYGAEKLLRDAMVMPIYEGTSQIQALMAMKDVLNWALKNPQGFVARRAQAQWRAMRARDDLERGVARLQQISMAAQQHLITRTATAKFKSLSGKPVGQWPQEFLKNWNPKRDFAYAMLHAERLIRILADEAICELLLAQVRKHPERREILARYLERAEPRCRFLLDEITTTGNRLLAQLKRDEQVDEQAAQ